MRIRISIKVHISIDHERAEMKSKKSAPLTSRCSFLAEAAKSISRLSDSLSQSTIANYTTALRSFSSFIGRDIDVDKVDASLMHQYQRWLLDRGLCLNTISAYMRSLRSLLNQVCKQMAVDKGNCFSSVYTGNSRTEKRAVPESVISKLAMLNLPQGTFLALVRDVFIFCYYAMGMPFVDVAFLRRSQVSNGQIVYHRHKTGQRVVVSIEPCMQRIMDRYNDSHPEYVFPLIDSVLPRQAYRQYLQILNRYNRSLKQLARQAGIEQRLTSYVARHTWASAAYRANVDLPVISQALGHTNPQTTLVYIRELDDHRLAEANRLIVNSI